MLPTRAEDSDVQGEAYVYFNRYLEPGNVSLGGWELVKSGLNRIVGIVTATHDRVIIKYSQFGSPDQRPDQVSYLANPPVLLGYKDRTPAAAFAGLPLEPPPP